MARPVAPPAQWTSASTVGLPRLSSTCRAWTRVIVSFTGAFLRKRGKLLLTVGLHIIPAVGPLLQDGSANAAHGLALRLLGQVLDRAGAVDAGQQAYAEMLHAAALQLRDRAEADG